MNLSATQHNPVDPKQALHLKELIFNLVQCCREKIYQESERFGLPPAELRCLMLFKEEGYRTAKELSKSLEVGKSRTSKIVEGLIHKNLLERWIDPKDARRRLLNLSKGGQAKLAEVEAYLLNTHAMILAQLEPELRAAVLEHLERLSAAINKVKRDLFGNGHGSQ